MSFWLGSAFLQYPSDFYSPFRSMYMPFRTWRLFKTEVELHMGTCCGLNSAGTAFVALASCVAEGVCLWSFPAQRLAIVRDELLHIFR